MEKGEVKRNRLGADTKISRRYRRLFGNQEWFQQKKKTLLSNRQQTLKPQGSKPNEKEDKSPDNVLFIPSTKQGALKTKLTEMERRMNFPDKIRYVETVGQTVGAMLVRQDPWTFPCDRDRCMTCQETPGRCMKKGIVYQISCTKCLETGRHTVYFGESSRTSYDRGLEHQKLLQDHSPESPLYEHHQEDHPDMEPDFRMKVLGVFKRPLQRQTKEGQLIADFKGGNLLNRKGEWGQNLPPQIRNSD